MRQDFRQFRIDRIQQIEVGTETFADEAGKTLADLLRQIKRPPLA